MDWQNSPGSENCVKFGKEIWNTKSFRMMFEVSRRCNDTVMRGKCAQVARCLPASINAIVKKSGLTKNDVTDVISALSLICDSSQVYSLPG